MCGRADPQRGSSCGGASTPICCETSDTGCEARSGSGRRIVVAVERLALEQRLGDPLELGPVVGHHPH